MRQLTFRQNSTLYDVWYKAVLVNRITEAKSTYKAGTILLLGKATHPGKHAFREARVTKHVTL